MSLVRLPQWQAHRTKISSAKPYEEVHPEPSPSPSPYPYTNLNVDLNPAPGPLWARGTRGPERGKKQKEGEVQNSNSPATRSGAIIRYTRDPGEEIAQLSTPDDSLRIHKILELCIADVVERPQSGWCPKVNLRKCRRCPLGSLTTFREVPFDSIDGVAESSNRPRVTELSSCKEHPRWPVRGLDSVSIQSSQRAHEPLLPENAI